MAKFNPGLQTQYCRDLDRAFFGKAPTLELVCHAYGRNTAESWLEIQLNDLSEFAGCKEKLSKAQICELAAMIFESYPCYRLTEFMLFFQRFKRCEYGKFYGVVDPMVIMQALSTFENDRRKIIWEKRAEEKRAEQETIDREFDAVKERYKQRVPDAFTERAAITFVQYRLMGFDYMDDDALRQELQAIRSGEKKIPDDVNDIYATLQAAFGLTNPK